MENNLQKLKIENGNLMIDGFKMENVVSYKLIKSSAESPTELSITLLVEDINNAD